MTDHTPETQEVEEVEPTPATPEVQEGTQEQKDDGDADTFPRSYVEGLRRENAEARVKAKRADELAARLHGALVAATGRLADPADLPFDEAHLDDESALSAAIDDLLASKPHLASRRPRGDVGQGARAETQTVSLGALLRARA